MCVDGQFSKIQSHMYVYAYVCMCVIRMVTTVLLKNNVANSRNFFAIYEWLSSLSSAL